MKWIVEILKEKLKKEHTWAKFFKDKEHYETDYTHHCQRIKDLDKAISVLEEAESNL